MANKILTVSELAEHLNVHRITIYRLLKNGSLPGFKIGRVWRFDLDEITSWMASGKSSRQMLDGDGLEKADGRLHGGQLQTDGHAQRDGHPKAARKQSRILPPRGKRSKETRAEKSPRS